MKILAASIAIAILSFLSAIYIPVWWFFALIALFICFLIPQKATRSFFSGFLGLFILWLAICIWIDQRNESILSIKVASIVGVGTSKWVLILATSIIGGIIGGLAGISGTYLRLFIRKT